MIIPAEARVRFGRKISPLKQLVETKCASAEEVASALLFVWARRVQPDQAPRRAPNKTVALVADSRVSTFVDWLCTFEKFEEAAYWVATSYATLVGEETRTQKALYFTHPVLAERVIDGLLTQGASLLDDHWHDPACGGAAFLVPVALRMRNALLESGCSPQDVVAHINKNLSGNDTSRTLIGFSETFLNLALASVLQESGCELKVRITQGDGLRSWRGSNRPTVVICNPPYRKLKADEAAQYKTTFREALQGQPNIYALFIEQALKIVRPGGLIGLLTPTSYLTGPLFSRLRKYVCDASRIHSIDLLGNRSSTFLNVEQETAIATLRATEQQEHQDVAVSVWKETGFESVGAIRLRKDGRPWVLPRSAQDEPLIRLTEKSPYRLKDYGYVPRVGALVAYRSERVTHSSEEGCKEKQVVPLIWATDITPQGEFVHGRQHRQRAPELFIEIESRSATGVFSQPAVLLQRLTSTDQSRRLIAAALPDKFLHKHRAYVCENHVIALLKEKQSEWQPHEIAALLRTSSVDRLYRAISGSSNVGTYELGQLPLPCPSRLRAELSKGLDMESAMRGAFAQF